MRAPGILAVIGVVLLAIVLGAGCQNIPPPEYESRMLNQQSVRCGSDENDVQVRCALATDEFCCIDGDARGCMTDETACNGQPMLCDDPTDCEAGTVCCQHQGGAECRAPEDCNSAFEKPSCVVDWNCAEGKTCRENRFISDIYLCD